MSFDGLFTHGMVDELGQTLENGRISKIHQPYKNEIVLVIRANGKNHKLLLSSHPSYARIQLTEIPYENPAAPPTFCMILRKYLEGAVLKEIKQIENDRIVHFIFKNRDEIGDMKNIILVAEIMGRHSNLFLIEESEQKIIDCIKHISPLQNSFRTLLPGATYINPPKSNQLNPFDAEFFLPVDQPELSMKQLIQKTYQGIGADTAVEISYQAEEKLAHFPKAMQKMVTDFSEKNLTPTLIIQGNKSSFVPLPFASISGERQSFQTLSELLDAFYQGKAERDRVQQQGADLIRIVQTELNRNQKKLVKLQQSLDETEHADIYRIKGELLTAFLYEMEKGMPEITLANFYEDNQPLKIALDVRKTPSQNAQKYFAKYQKLKNAVAYIHEQQQLTQVEVDYLESVATQIELASPKDLVAIKEELQQEGYLKKQKKMRTEKKSIQAETYLATDGTVILVGKNNFQNDQLTLKTAKKTDIWLHTKNIPGSHVIIQSAEPSEETLLEAANIAAYFSKSQLSASVPVDIVPVKKIRKPNGAKPGYVIYEGQRTVHVTPDAELVSRLRKK
ncbi:NFACT RNA binding domain-containing protein [Isobaculum melis]|uniref:Rqc2 homolog RqcH n=1 Tax=Isobaculum melis TaxID=142588 RepID=A0A1H9T0F3_9LACT|nr:NFACT RNA binding domain-containing protein [Isobaculum melis]SER90628.1 Predicted component of the ribosome quality control (RQC) complex, YloA/Tae2 family, contains fibronectin-binding (FbpA) and DUF814 domains [Isobaculum melis]